MFDIFSHLFVLLVWPTLVSLLAYVLSRKIVQTYTTGLNFSELSRNETSCYW